MQWKYGNQTFAEIDHSSGFSITGVHTVGGHRLRVGISLLLHGRAAGDMLNLLWIGGALATEAGPLALLHGVENLGLATATTSFQHQIWLAADLTGRQIDALSELRARDGSLRLHVAVWGMANGSSGVERFYDQDWFTVAAADWRSAWAAMTPAQAFTIEVSTPRVDADAPLAASIGHLHRAAERLRHVGEESEAVGECRLALEAAGYRNLPRMSAPLPEKQLEKDLSLDERLAVLKRSLYRITHLAHHPGTEAFSQPQARLVLEVTSSLLSLEARGLT